MLPMCCFLCGSNDVNLVMLVRVGGVNIDASTFSGACLAKMSVRYWCLSELMSLIAHELTIPLNIALDQDLMNLNVSLV